MKSISVLEFTDTEGITDLEKYTESSPVDRLSELLCTQINPKFQELEQELLEIKESMWIKSSFSGFLKRLALHLDMKSISVLKFTDTEGITDLEKYTESSPVDRLFQLLCTPLKPTFQELEQELLEIRGSRWIKKKHEQQLKLEALPFRQPRLISGYYSVRNTNGKVRLEMEHCAFNGRKNQWNLEVKCRIQDKKFTGTNGQWVNINEQYRDAKVEMKHNFVYVTIDSPDENHEFAVFGTPEVNDKKRMQLGLFGEKPVKGKDWKIWAILFDDTMMAFEHVCEMEEGRGRQLLSTLGGLLVTNCSQDIEINLTDMELGWKIKGSKVKTIKSNDAWNSPENSTDFPRCYFEINHVDKTKQSFFCEVTASHKENTTDTDAMAFYEEAEKMLLMLIIYPIATKMLCIAKCYANIMLGFPGQLHQISKALDTSRV